MQLTGKHVVVTGGAGGIGEALCEAFAAAGAARIVVADLDGEGTERVAKAVGGVAAPLNVRDPEALTAMVERAESDGGPIDLFCSNAGIGIHGGPEVDDDGWQAIWEVNLMSHVWLARVLVPRMLARGGGYLLNTASAAGLLAQIGSAPYSVTKHAAVAFAEWLAITYGAKGLKVSILCPQAVRTAMTAGTEDGGVAGVDGMMEPDEVARSVVQGLADERLWILPHPEVEAYVRRRAEDPDRWIAGMQRLQARYEGG